MGTKKNKFFDISIDYFDSESIITEIFKCVENEEKTIFLGINADCFNISEKNETYKRILQNSKYYVYPDGISIVWIHRMFNKINQERIVTTDLILYLLDRISKEKKAMSITFMGGDQGIAELAKNKLNKKYSIDSISDSMEPEYLSLEEIQNSESKGVAGIIRQLNERPTDILFIGFGCPKQEILANTILAHIPQKVLITCGGLFSYYAGEHKRAPKLMQKIGLEWLFRLILEPKRLWKRYLIGNVIFLKNVFQKKP